MKPAPFTYHRPSTLEETLSLLDAHEDAELMAGNQSLGIIMANRLARPGHLLDINAIEDLSYIDLGSDSIEIGAMTRHRTLERSERLRQRLQLFPEAAEKIAGPSVRNRGTVGGSLAEADPAGNYPTVVVALDATLNLVSVDGRRSIPADEFFIAHMFTDMHENELIESVTIRTDEFTGDRFGSAFTGFKRASHAFPIVSVAALIQVDDPTETDPLVTHARLALANVAERPLRIDQVSDILEGEQLDERTLKEVADVVAESVDPVSDAQSSATLKTELAQEYARRSLTKSHRRAIEL